MTRTTYRPGDGVWSIHDGPRHIGDVIGEDHAAFIAALLDQATPEQKANALKEARRQLSFVWHIGRPGSPHFVRVVQGRPQKAFGRRKHL